jgi:hypothetical protein
MDEVVKAILAALDPITASVSEIAKGENGVEYGIELPDGTRLFVAVELA